MHLLQRAVLEYLEAVPVYLVEAQPGIPQPGFVLVEGGGEQCRIGRHVAVYLYLVPRYEHGVFVAPPFLAAHPLGMEVITHAVGCRLHRNQRQRYERHRAADRAYEVIGRARRPRAPEGCFAQVGHGIVGAAYGVGVLA